jgi:hypothetical protein
MVSLRRTNRLARHVASHGHAFYKGLQVGGDVVELYLENPVEVEFVSQSTAESEGNNENAGDFPFAPQRDWSFDKLRQLMRSQHDSDILIIPFEEADDRDIFLERMKDAQRSD